MSTERPHDPDTPLDGYVDAFVARLHDVPVEATAAPTPRRGIGRRAPLAALALSEARAALSPDGAILHLKITNSSSDSNGTTSLTTEQWIADGPPRWRFVQVVPPAGAPHSTGVVFYGRGTIEGRSLSSPYPAQPAWTGLSAVPISLVSWPGRANAVRKKRKNARCRPECLRRSPPSINARVRAPDVARRRCCFCTEGGAGTGHNPRRVSRC